MAIVFKDFGTAYLAAPLAVGGLTITVDSPSSLPVLQSGDYFYLVLQKYSDRSYVEIVKVTATVGSTYTIQRGQAGTVARAFALGDYAELRLTVGGLSEFIAQGIGTKMDKSGGGDFSGIYRFLNPNTSRLDIVRTSDDAVASVALDFSASEGHRAIFGGPSGANVVTSSLLLRPNGYGNGVGQVKIDKDGVVDAVALVMRGSAQRTEAGAAVRYDELGKFVPKTRTINGHALSADFSIDASDVGALPTNIYGGTPAAAYFITAAVTTEGTKIRLPFRTNSGRMVTFTVRAYQGFEHTDIQFSGYLYPATDQWYLPKATMTSGTASINVAVGRDTDGIAYVWLAGSSNRGVAVINVVSGYVPADWNTGWAISMTDSAPTQALNVVLHPPFSKNNPPTATDVGALPILGGELSGGLVVKDALRVNGIGGHASVERSAVGSAACMDWVERGTGNWNFSQSTGAGVEVRRLMTLTPNGDLTINGAVYGSKAILSRSVDGSSGLALETHVGVAPYISANNAGASRKVLEFTGDTTTNHGRLISTGVVGVASTNYPMFELHHPALAAYGMYIDKTNGQLCIGQTNGSSAVARALLSIDGGGNATFAGEVSSGSGSGGGRLGTTGMVYGSVWGGDGSIAGWIQRNFAPISDATLKRNIKPATKSALDDVAKLVFVAYDWDSTNPLTLGKKSTHIGVTAQQVEEVDDSYVRDVEPRAADGSVGISVKSLDLVNLLSLALKAIQEQSTQVSSLRSQVARLLG